MSSIYYSGIAWKWYISNILVLTLGNHFSLCIGKFTVVPFVFIHSRHRILTAWSWWITVMVNLWKALNLQWWYVHILYTLLYSLWWRAIKCHYWCSGCRFDCGQFDKKSWWDYSTMWWICCRERKMGKSSISSSVCTWPWSWLWRNSWWHYASIFPGFVPFTSNGRRGYQGIGICIS